MSSQRRAAVIGIGMIGGSIAAALRKRDWYVTGDDIDGERARAAQSLGIVDAVGIDDGAEITFIATPVSAVAERAINALERGGVVTDAGSVKGAIVEKISHPRFVGGHPMAGSERSGLEATNADLFEGATWVLTPTEHTDPEAYVSVLHVITSLGASALALPADEHDRMVATVSHVPHLTSSALMNVALHNPGPRDALLRLAAGGFRDMTRIAAGHPDLWTDIVLQNRHAIAEGLEKLHTELEQLQEYIVNADRERLRKLLDEAATARREFPIRSGGPRALTMLRIPIPDRPGVLGTVLGVFGTVHVNIEDLEIAHDVKGDRGALHVTIDSSSVERATEALVANEFRVAVEHLR